MDAILSRWGAAGCKTLSECHAASERDRTTLLEEKKGRRTERKREKSEEPKYAAFSAEDALMRALERSYGSSDEEG